MRSFASMAKLLVVTTAFRWDGSKWSRVCFTQLVCSTGAIWMTHEFLKMWFCNSLATTQVLFIWHVTFCGRMGCFRFWESHIPIIKGINWLCLPLDEHKQCLWLWPINPVSMTVSSCCDIIRASQWIIVGVITYWSWKAMFMAVPEAALETKPLSYVSMNSVIASTLFVIKY